MLGFRGQILVSGVCFGVSTSSRCPKQRTPVVGVWIAIITEFCSVGSSSLSYKTSIATKEAHTRRFTKL